MKKSIITGVAAIAVSFILMIVFIVGGVSSIQSGPAGTLEKLEKAINKGDGEKALSYFGLQNSIFTAQDLPYYGQNVNFIPGDVEKIEGEENRVILHYAVVYEENGVVSYSMTKDTFVKKNGKWIIDIF